jgi:hypothetical protein
MINLKASGIEALLAKFNTLANEAQNDVQYELNVFADDVVRDAKLLVKANSYDEGNLLRNINPEYGSGSVTITANTKYAAYIEFGTRKFAAEYVSSLPPDWQAFASTFKGKSNSGDYYDFLNAILDWVSRKGITARYSVKTKKKLKNNKEDDERLLAAATAIAFSILKNGIKPKPFMYPSINKNLPVLIQNIKDVFK